MTPEQASVIREHCRQTLAEYAMAVDDRDAAALAAAFAPGGVLQRGEVALRGDDLPKLFDGRAEDMVMRHLVTTQSIMIAPGGRSARARSYYLLHTGLGDSLPLALTEAFSMGDWHSELVPTPMGWKLSRHAVNRVFVRPAAVPT